eukprot:5878057-Alexandrium_andersonii.AAC.1
MLGAVGAAWGETHHGPLRQGRPKTDWWGGIHIGQRGAWKRGELPFMRLTSVSRSECTTCMHGQQQMNGQRH